MKTKDKDKMSLSRLTFKRIRLTVADSCNRP
jgi:hypothetical protein